MERLQCLHVVFLVILAGRGVAARVYECMRTVDGGSEDNN